jgi:PKD repeat protein
MPTNYALNSNGSSATATNFLAAGFEASQAIDGTLGAYYHSATQSSITLEIDLGQNRTFNQIKVKTNRTDTGYNFGYSIDYWNGSTWVNIVTGQSTTNGVSEYTHNFSNVTGSKVRLVSTGAEYTTITEFEVTGDPPDSTPPTISITTPSASSTNISGNSVNIVGTCADNIGVVGVQLKLNGTNWGAEITGSGLTSFNVNRDSFDFPNGTYTLTAVARDAGGNTTTSASKTVIIQNAPTAGFSIPSAGAVGVPVAITNQAVDATSYAYDKENNGSTDSTSPAPSFTFDAPGTYTVKQTVTNSFGSANTTRNIVITDVLPLNYGFDAKEVALFCEASNLAQADNSNVTSWTDQSIYARHLTAPSSYPTYQTNEINSKPVVRFNSSNPLKNTAEFTIRCGWILAKYDGGTFPDTADGYKGLLSDLVAKKILSGKRNSDEFEDFGFDYYEFRSNDRIYSVNIDGELHAPAPMAGFKLIFFRFWTNLEVDGIQIGQELNNANRKWSGDVALIILSSEHYCESIIRERSQAIATAYGLTLANVFPYQAEKSSSVQYTRSLNFYDPPEGDRIAEVLDETKQNLNLQFNLRRQKEFKAARIVHRNNYPEIPIIYRNYNLIPPEDVEGYISSELEWTGAVNNFNYAFQFKEK